MPGKYFYPRPPRGGRRRSANARTNPSDFYPRPPRGGRPRSWTETKYVPTISIHALREEGDQTPHSTTSAGSYFYPRPPRGGRPNTLTIGSEAWLFLSTPSARRATFGQICLLLPCHDFYPRPPRGGRHVDEIPPEVAEHFYPRPPRGGRHGQPTHWV